MTVHLRLRPKLTLALVGLALVPLAVATLVLVQVNLDHLALSAKEYRMAVADGAVRTVRDFVDQARTELVTAASALAERDVPLDDRVRAARAHIVGAHRLTGMAVYDAEGAHVDTFTAGEVAAPAVRPDRLAPGLLARATRDGVAFDDAPAASGAGALAVVVPVYRGAERALWGHAWSAVDLQPLCDQLADASATRFGGRRDRVYVVDPSLRVVVHGDRALLGTSVRGRGLDGAAGVGGGPLLGGVEAAYAADYEADGEALLGVLLPLTELGWGLVVEQDRDTAYRAVQATWQTALVVGVTFLVIATVMGLLLGRRLAEPVLAVARAAKRVAGGDFSARVEAHRHDEVGELAGSFNAMTTDLVTYRERVIEETRARTNLSRFLSPDVVETIVARTTDLELGGERREVTVLFADVVAFTPLTERLPPERLVAILNELFTILTEIVFRHGGTVDKFVGDCVMAVFGAPYGHDDDAVRAARAAEEMLRWLEIGNARWTHELGQELQLAIGMITGTALAGNIGSKKRMEYTVIGDAVNVAARLETVARPNQVLLTRETMRRIQHEFACVRVASQRFPGRSTETEIYTLAT